MIFRWNEFFDIFVKLLPYIKNTVILAIAIFFLSFVLACLITLVFVYDVPVLRRFFKIYSSFFRSTPLVAQLFFFYFAITSNISIMKNMSNTIALVVTMTLNESAFIAETLRGALSSVDLGQKEAALSLGMTDFQAMKRIVFPQAFRVAVPSLSNTFIAIVKGTSVGFTIGVIELMSQAKLLSAIAFRVMEGYLAVLLIYWFIIVILSRAQVSLEKKINKAY